MHHVEDGFKVEGLSFYFIRGDQFLASIVVSARLMMPLTDPLVRVDLLQCEPDGRATIVAQEAKCFFGIAESLDSCRPPNVMTVALAPFAVVPGTYQVRVTTSGHLRNESTIMEEHRTPLIPILPALDTSVHLPFGRVR